LRRARTPWGAPLLASFARSGIQQTSTLWDLDTPRPGRARLQSCRKAPFKSTRLQPLRETNLRKRMSFRTGCQARSGACFPGAQRFGAFSTPKKQSSGGRCRGGLDRQDEHGASSNIATAPSCSTLRTREHSCGFRPGTAPMRGSRSHPSCDNPCGFYHRRGPVRWHLAVKAWPVWILAWQSRRSGIAQQGSDAVGACDLQGQSVRVEMRQLSMCAWRWED
jgi:hypothetical protein